MDKQDIENIKYFILSVEDSSKYKSKTLRNLRNNNDDNQSDDSAERSNTNNTSGYNKSSLLFYKYKTMLQNMTNRKNLNNI